MIKEIENIYDLINLVERRPELYIGDARISSLRIFLDGYQFSATVHNIEKEQVFPPFWYFHEWAMHKYGWGESTAGWKNIILEENQNDEELALKKCFELLKEFRTLKPISIKRSKLNQTNIKFHHSENCKIKRCIDPVRQLTEPLYENADEIFIVQFSHDFGFSIFVKLNDESIGFNWRERFKTNKEAVTKSETLFGESLKWEYLTGDLLSWGNLIIKENNTANKT
ncbi:hypothetical protein [Aureivirga sp. CE67]|uniref:hypothetical protein n=1 Tax=Aureivirga sp. CE67 TaxID=1788983 RepID=UPI0018C98153|nr:hypothetical protein [Aureivirga sp. CE67]